VRSYSELLQRRVPVPSERIGDVNEYLKRMSLWHRYKEIRGASDQELAGAKLELQDVLLSDPRLPSASGAVTDRVLDEPVQFALALKLIRPGSYTLTDRGRSLQVAASRETEALVSQRFNVNAMRIPPGAGLLLCYALLEADLDFLKVSYEEVLSLGETFSRSAVSRRMSVSCRNLRDQYRRQIRTGEDRKKMARLEELAKSIDKAKDAPTWGGARPPDQTSTVRLEPMVDLGLLTRSSRFDYNYHLERSQREFFTKMVAAKSAEWLDTDLVGAYAEARSLPTERVEPELEWDAIRRAWGHLRSPMGYASIREALLLANAELLDAGHGCFDIATGETILRERQRQVPRSIRFTMGRGGGVSYFRLSDIGGSRT
jgi:hypothetical protein